jgi:hypothetical protein
MAITITVQVDADRLREAGLSDNPADVMAALEAMRGGRLSLQTGDHWIPVRNLRAWQRLGEDGPAPDPFPEEVGDRVAGP